MSLPRRVSPEVFATHPVGTFAATRHVYLYMPEPGLIFSGFLGWLEREDFDLLSVSLEADAPYDELRSLLDLRHYLGTARGNMMRFTNGGIRYLRTHKRRLKKQVMLLPRAAYLAAFWRGGATIFKPPWEQLFAKTVEEATTFLDRPALAASVDAIAKHLLDAQRASAMGDLTQREHAIATLVGRGLTDADIAATVGVRETTVGSHLHRIYRKLNVHSRTELLAAMDK